jgi:hypothetical protein
VGREWFGELGRVLSEESETVRLLEQSPVPQAEESVQALVRVPAPEQVEESGLVRVRVRVKVLTVVRDWVRVEDWVLGWESVALESVADWDKSCWFNCIC